MRNILKINELAKMYKVSRKTVYNWIEKGLPVIRRDGITRFDEEEVWKWFHNEEVK